MRARFPISDKLLAMIDRARAWGLPLEVVIADAGYAVVTTFRTELRERRPRYVVGIVCGGMATAGRCRGTGLPGARANAGV